jgi:site-specific recombinase XerC
MIQLPEIKIFRTTLPNLIGGSAAVEERLKEPIDLATATVEAISDWLASMGESKSPALFVSSRDTRLSVDRLYQIVGGLAAAGGIDSRSEQLSRHKCRLMDERNFG